MSSSSRQLVSIPPDDAASREDLELFQRLLRVARLFKNHEVDDLCSYLQSDHVPALISCQGIQLLRAIIQATTERATGIQGQLKMAMHQVGLSKPLEQT